MKNPAPKNVCEEQVFQKLFEAHAEPLFKFLYYRYGGTLEPRDKVQDAFIKLWENCAKVTPEKAKSYVFTIGNNLMLNAYKHLKVVRSHEKQTVTGHDNQDPQFLMEEREYKKKYDKALASLTVAQREAFLLNRVEGKRHKEIAELLGISRKAVEKRLYGALEKMRVSIKGL